MAGTVSDTDAYYKVYKSLHLLTYEALPSVDNSLKVWHSNQQQALPVCTGQCPNGKKPKAPSSCQNCVAWGNAIEAAFYPLPVSPAKPQITWQNVTQSNLGKSHIEAAKAYVLRLPKTKGTPGSTQYTRISDFDSASVLMIMARFSEFHGGDQLIYGKIMKVVEIRNSLSHMGLHANMLVDDQKVKEYFRDLESLVRRLAQLHPQQFTSAQDVIDKFQRIQMESVTDKMREEINMELRTEVLKLKETVKNEKPCGFDLTQCQHQLKADYKSTRSGIAFLPVMPKTFSLDEFFVDLNLVEEELRPTGVIRKKLVEYTDLFSLENSNGERLDHILIRGEAGSGKTTLLNRLAHQWATASCSDGADEAKNPLNEFEFVFDLNIRGMKPGMDLVDCIQDQLMPDLIKESIHSMLIAHADSCLFLFDGYDELKSHQEVLSSKLLHRSFVIVTTRPDKVDRFCQKYSGFVHIQLTGFTEESKATFISKYFASAASEMETGNSGNDKAAELIEKIDSTCLDPLSLFPLLLAMMCSIFNKFGDIPTRMTALYQRAVDVFAIQYYAKTSSSSYLSETQRMDIDSVLLSLGPTALRGLLIDDGKLIFNKEDFENCHEQTNSHIWMILLNGILPSIGYELGAIFDSSSLQFALAVIGLITGLNIYYFSSTRGTVDEANTLGLLSKVYNDYSRIKNSKHCEYSFLHKTFQEFAAARYWSNLAASNKGKFEYYLTRINEENVNSMQYLLRFACGMSYDAAEMILKHVTSICKEDWQFAVTLLFEAERGSLIHPPLHAIPTPLKLTIGGWLYVNEELWSILHHYASHRQGADKNLYTWLNSIKKLEIYVNASNLQHLTRFLSNGADLMTNLTSLEIGIDSAVHLFETSAFETSLMHFTKRQLHLCQLGMADERAGTSLDWEMLLTSEVFTHLIPKLESLSLDGLNICVSSVLDILINTGKHIERTHLADKRTGTVGVCNTQCLQHSLPMLRFSLYDCNLINDQPGPSMYNLDTGDSNHVHQTQKDCRPGVLYKLKEALSFMPCLEEVRLDIGLTAAYLRVLVTVISRMVNLQVVDLSYEKCDHKRYYVFFRKSTNNLQHAGIELSEILQNSRNLRKLNLGNTNLTDDDIKILSTNQPSILTITEIDLSENQFGSQGCIHLSGLMKHTPMLEKLRLYRNTVHANGVAEFSSALRYVPLLTHLDMTLGDKESYILLAEGFRHVPKLQTLCLISSGSTMMSLRCAETIFRNLVYLPDLQELRFPGFPTAESHISDIVRACMPVLQAGISFRYSHVMSVTYILFRKSKI